MQAFRWINQRMIAKMASLDSLQRFVEAQAPVYDQAIREIRQGRKTSHWMWFIFPQMTGLGHSETSRYFGIRNRAEAEAYLAHPLLGARLRACVAALQDLPTGTAKGVFGVVDALKLQSSLTLFAAIEADDLIFQAALDRWFSGAVDQQTLKLLTSDDAPASES
jgi:uncharacterized protein (DUF1810 family)